MNEFNEKHIRYFYRLLNHKEITELRFLKRGLFPGFAFVNNENDFVTYCKKWNGKRNIYAGIRDRKKGIRKCATANEIIGIQTIVIDIDPIRETEIPSTKEELENALKVSEKIIEWFTSHNFKAPYRAMTGNGICLYFSVPWYEIADENRWEVTQKLEWFEKEMRRIFKNVLKEHNCKIDSMYDLPRIAKVIGTMSVKGENTKERPWRLSFWIDEPKERREDPRLLSCILSKNLLNPTYRESLSPVWLMQPIPYFGEKLSGEWIYEPKIDGWRMEIIKFQGKVEFWGRRLEKKPNWTQKLKKIIPRSSLGIIPDGTILDSELYSNKGRRFIPSLFASKSKAKPIIYIFDIIFYKGEFMGSLPLKERKKILESIDWKEPFQLVEYKKVINIEKHLKEALMNNHEGIVVKELNSPYVVGEDSPMATAHWRKIKPK